MSGGLTFVNAGSGALNLTGATQVAYGSATPGILLGSALFTYDSATGIVTAKGVTAAGGTVTTSAPPLIVTQTWNAGGVTFTAAKVNVTATASAAGSLLLDLQVGGVSQFSVTKAGAVTLGALTASSITDSGLTSGRVTFASTAGLLADSANLTWNGTTFAVTGAATVSTTLGVTGLATLTAGLTTPAQITSTIATGTAPFVVASTTNVPNLNASTLSGKTHADPGPIGSGTASTGAFTALTASSTLDVTGAATFSATLAVQSAASAAALATVGSLNALAGTTQVAVYANLTGTAAGTTSVRGFQADVRSAAAAYTMTNAIGFLAGSGSIGAGSTVTRFSGFHASNGHGATNKACLSYSTSATLPTFSGSYFLYNEVAAPSYTAGAFTIADTTDATALGTAALVCSGGVSVGLRLILDGATGKTLRIANGVANAAVATTLGSVGPTGSTAGNPQGWMRVDINGTDRYIPFW